MDLETYALLKKRIDQVVGGQQGDWNQNDSTKPGYIKNRPFYSQTATDEILPLADYAFMDIGTGQHYAWLDTKSVLIKLFKFDEVTVTFDGQEYQCKVIVKGTECAVGNFAIYGPPHPDSGEPFLITYNQDPDTMSGGIMTRSTAATHSVSVMYKNETVVPIDKKYLTNCVNKKYIDENFAPAIKESVTGEEVLALSDVYKIKKCTIGLVSGKLIRYGKNLINLANRVPISYSGGNVPRPDISENDMVIGITATNVSVPGNIRPGYSLVDNKDLTCSIISSGALGYGIGFPFKVKSGLKYYASVSNPNESERKFRIGFYDASGNWLSEGKNGIAAPAEAVWGMMVCLPVLDKQDTLFSDLMLVEQGVDNKYEPYINPIEYTADEAGNVTGIDIPSTDITLVCEYSTINVDYLADTERYIDKRLRASSTHQPRAMMMAAPPVKQSDTFTEEQNMSDIKQSENKS